MRNGEDGQSGDGQEAGLAGYAQALSDCELSFGYLSGAEIRGLGHDAVPRSFLPTDTS